MALWAVALATGAWLYRRMKLREESRRRAYAEAESQSAMPIDDFDQRGFMSRWLYLAGYRSRGATATFVASTTLMLVLGIAIAMATESTGITQNAVRAASGVPGGLGDLAAPILVAGPWIVVLLLAMVPWSVVNSSRKRRVQDVEADMPVTLELLATMSESGLGFDSALARVIDSRRDERPLFQDLKTFQLEVLGGISRVQCFRRLAKRLEVPSIYYAHTRPIVRRRGALVPVTHLTPPRDGESVERVSVRFRTVGDIPCTAPVASDAANAREIIIETAAATITERGATRLDDQTNDASMELRKKAGYF